MELQEIRARIDALDTELIGLFKKRMELAKDVAHRKREHGLHVEDHAREREVMGRMCKLAGEPLEQYARMLYSVLFDVSRSYQRRFLYEENALVKHIQAACQDADVQFPKRGVVACAGREGSYSQIACEKLFAAPEIVFFNNFEAVFRAVEQGLCEYGILPIENSSNGSVDAVCDLMRNYRFHIVRSTCMHIDHSLLAKPGVDFSEIREIVSHDQAIGQCGEFLSAHPHIKITYCENTATAAKIVADSDRRDLAAIASRNCAWLYGPAILSEDVQNSANNYTRFICIAKDMIIYPGADRLSFLCSTAHTPGALYKVMAGIAALGINITKLESRPIPGRDFEFSFYFDVEASVWNADVLKLLGKFADSDDLFVFLGGYSEIS